MRDSTLSWSVLWCTHWRAIRPALCRDTLVLSRLRPLVTMAALAVSLGMSSPVEAREQRFIVQGQVNGLPAALALDTGTSVPLAIPRRHLDKFRLSVEQKVTGSNIVEGFTNPVTIKLPPNHTAENVRFAVFEDGPAALEYDFDAMVGWPGMRRMQLQFRKQDAKTLLGDGLSAGTGAASFPMLPSDVLEFDADPGAESLPVMIDTGWSGGVRLSRDLWNAWRARNPRPYTLSTGFSPQHGLVVSEQLFAAEFEIGGLKLRNVIVSETPQSVDPESSEPKVVLGLDAFINHELLIDGPSDRVFVGRPERTLLKPQYNRLGATFAPDSLAARVAPDSPAALADIRDGDILQLIDGVPPAQYAAQRSERNIWEQPSGTRVTLTLRRAGSEITREVTLRDFIELGP